MRTRHWIRQKITMDRSQFNIREYQESDLEGILDLWENHSGWGRPGEEEFRKWMKTPYGNCYVIVVENTLRNIVGQMIYTPAEIYINGLKQKALKASAPIIHSNFRKGNLFESDSLVIQMMKSSYEIVKQKGYHWLYSFPAYGWKRLIMNFHHFGLNHWKTELFPCLGIGEQEKSINTFRLESFDEFSNEIEEIWENLKINHGELSFLTRDNIWLKYKWNDCLKIGFYNNSDSLEGYAVIKQNSGLLEDLVLNDFRFIPDALVQLSHFYKDHSDTLNKNNQRVFKFMPNGMMREQIKDIKTYPVDFQFLFAISSFENYSGADSLDMDKWYVFPSE